MKIVSLAVFAAFAGAMVSPALAQDKMPHNEITGLACKDFRKNNDGSWNTTREVTLTGPAGSKTFGKDVMFPKDTAVEGLLVAKSLDNLCR